MGLWAEAFIPSVYLLVLFLLTVGLVLCRSKGSGHGLHCPGGCGPFCSGTAQIILVPGWPAPSAPKHFLMLLLEHLWCPSLRSPWESHLQRLLADTPDARPVSVSLAQPSFPSASKLRSCGPHRALGLCIHCFSWSHLIAWHTVDAQ